VEVRIKAAFSTYAGFKGAFVFSAGYLRELSFSVGLIFLVPVCIVKQYSC